jgi:Sigma-70 region 2
MFNPFAESDEGDRMDAELVEQAKNGDRGALERLVLRHKAWIYNIAVRVVFRPHDAEEVTQEVLVNIITKLSTFQGESKFPHVALLHHRKPRPQHEAPRGGDPGTDLCHIRQRHQRHPRPRSSRLPARPTRM